MDAARSPNEQVSQASRAIVHPSLVKDELATLPTLLGPDETLVRMMRATKGVKPGLLAVTDSRVLFLFMRKHTEIRISEITSVDQPTRRSVRLTTPWSKPITFDIQPKEQAPTVFADIRALVDASAGAREDLETAEDVGEAEQVEVTAELGAGPIDWRRLLDRLAAAETQASVDRERVERALRAFFRGLGIDPPAIRWVEDPVTALVEMRGRPPGFSAVEAATYQAAEEAWERVDRVERKAADASFAASAQPLFSGQGFGAVREAARAAQGEASLGRKAASWAADLQAGSLIGQMSGFASKEQQADTSASRAYASTYAVWRGLRWAAASEVATTAGCGDTALDRAARVWVPFVEAIEAGLFLFHVDQSGFIAVPRVPDIDIGEDARSIIARLAAATEGSPRDRRAAEEALAAHLEALGTALLPVEWVEDPETAFVKMGRFGDALRGRVNSELVKASRAGEASIGKAGKAVRAAADAATEQSLRLVSTSPSFISYLGAARQAIERDGETRRTARFHGSRTSDQQGSPFVPPIAILAGGAELSRDDALPRYLVAVNSIAVQASRAARWAAARDAAERIGVDDPTFDWMAEIWLPLVEAAEAGLDLYHVGRDAIVAVPRGETSIAT